MGFVSFTGFIVKKLMFSELSLLYSLDLVFFIYQTFWYTLICGFVSLVIFYRDFISLLIGLELSMLGVLSLFVFASRFNLDLFGEVAALAILVLAGADSALGLALVVLLYRLRGSIAIDQLTVLRG